MPEPQPRGRGLAPVAGPAILGLPYVRLTQRSKPPRARRSLWMLLALVLAAHVLLVWLAYLVLRPSPNSEHAGSVFKVAIIEPESALPLPPPLVPPPPLQGQPASAAPPRLHYVPPAPGAISATLEGVKGQPLELYGANGQIRLPPSTSPKPAPVFNTPELQGAPVLTIKTPIKYKPTIFNKGWAPLDQTLGDKTVGRAFDKAVEATTVQKTIRLPGGIKIHCAIAPLLLMAAGCGGEAPPPPKNDNDIRLSMPPAETLTGKKVPLPATASSVTPPTSGTP